MQPMCRAIDAAKTLRRSLRGEDTSPRHNEDRFKEFLALEIPAARPGAMPLFLVDARTGREADADLNAFFFVISQTCRPQFLEWPSGK